MGTVKNYIIERDDVRETLLNYLNSLETYPTRNKKCKEIWMIVKTILEHLDDNVLYFRTIDLINRLSYPIHQSLSTIHSPKPTETEKEDAITVLYSFFTLILQTMSDERKESSANYNSSQYYQEQIEKYEKREAELYKKISDLEKSAEGREELEKELANVKQIMQQMRQEQEEQQRRQDAQAHQRTNIQTAFHDLTTYSEPLEAEKTRLNWLFYIYGALCIATIILLTVYECRFLNHFNALPNAQWTDYLPFYLPVPLCGGLLWAFIYQMNRAQRQLVVLTDKLHHIKYIEGLLLAINTLSPDVSDAATKIQQTIDTIIDNYLHHPQPLTEARLQQETSKDQIDLKQLTGFVREIKELTRK